MRGKHKANSGPGRGRHRRTGIYEIRARV